MLIIPSIANIQSDHKLAEAQQTTDHMSGSRTVLHRARVLQQKTNNEHRGINVFHRCTVARDTAVELKRKKRTPLGYNIPQCTRGQPLKESRLYTRLTTSAQSSILNVEFKIFDHTGQQESCSQIESLLKNKKNQSSRPMIDNSNNMFVMFLKMLQIQRQVQKTKSCSE